MCLLDTFILLEARAVSGSGERIERIGWGESVLWWTMKNGLMPDNLFNLFSKFADSTIP